MTTIKTGPRPLTLHIRTALLAIALASAPGIATLQAAEPDAILHEYHIPAGPLSQVLSQFAAEAGILLSADASLADGKTSPGLNGKFTVQSALQTLLKNSGLQVQHRGDKRYSIQRLLENKTEQLPEVAVTARIEKEQAYSEIKGYVARQSATGSKTDTPIKEIPQSISVITRDQMDAQSAPSLQDALRYSAGIVSSRGVNITDDSFNIRGFAAGLATTNVAIYRDGMRQSLGTYDTSTEPYGLERVELLRGPAGVLFGQAAPGGVINIISKRPTLAPLHEMQIQLGSNNRKQVAADFGGALDDEGIWSYRLTGLVRDSDTMTNHIPDDRNFLSGSLAWRPSDKTSLIFQAMYQHSKTAYNWGLPPAGSILPNANGKISRHLFTGEPDFDNYETRTRSIGYLFEHHFNNTWTVRQNFRYYDSHLIWDSAYASALQSNNVLLNRFAYSRRDENQTYTLDNQLEAKWAHGIFDHTVLVGIDYLNAPWSSTIYRGNVGALNVYNPVYGSPVTLEATPRSDSLSTAYRRGLYLQDQLKIADKWVLLLSGRKDWARDTTENHLTDTRTSQSQDAFTVRTGLVYLFDNGMAPYLSYTEGFEPAKGQSYSGALFKPVTGKQKEIGFKYQPPGINASVTASLFHLVRQNVLTSDPSHQGYNVQTGETESHGLEIEATASPTSNLNLIASYTYTDVEITKSNNGDQGYAPAGVPKYMAALWADYTLHGEWMNGLGFGGGIRYAGKTSGYLNRTPEELPSYTVFDATAHYDIDASWRIAINANNLFDKKYIQSCYYGSTSCFYGSERNILATLRYRW